jgi:uncharacterized protein (TIGR03437 family)
MSCAADFTTGQAARAVLGQPTFTAQNAGASDTVVGAIGGLAYAANTLFATDANRLGLLPNNNRVLIFNNIGQMLPAADADIAPYMGPCPVCGGRASVVLGQPEFTMTPPTTLPAPSASNMRLPTAVASDGQMLAVADTANNRVLLWRTIPAANGQPADVVLGQPNFTTVGRLSINASTFRGPQGVWIQGGKLFVADTQNNRVLIWNSIPAQNNQPADVVLGQPNFTTAPQINQIDLKLVAGANTLLSPVSVTSDGQRLYVADLGFNRVLIWNSIPTANQQSADVEIGQTDFTQSLSNPTQLCPASGTDSNGNPTYPLMCAATMNFPRFALPDGRGRLFVADAGNDRILVFNSIPAVNGARADAILGQPNEFGDVYSTPNSFVVSTSPILSASNVTPTPTSLAWDGQNLYVADPTDYRILVFTPERSDVPLNGVVNAASRAIFAVGSVAIGGTITADNTVTVTINGTGYTYKVVAKDTVDSVAKALTDVINAANSGAGDSNVTATDEAGLATILLNARQPGAAGNNITLASSVSANATVTATASGSALAGGGDAATVAAGTLITINGSNLAESTASADLTQQQLPWELANVQVYFDGVRSPLLMVSPTQINAQIPFEIYGSNSISGWVRVRRNDGSVTVTSAVGVPVALAAPGLFADATPGATEPRTAMALHGSSSATGTFSVDGSIQALDVGNLVIGSNTYTYTVQSTDTLASIRDTFINLINANPAELVTASAAVDFNRIRLLAKLPGQAGVGIGLSATVAATAARTVGALLTLTATSPAMCCANTAGAPLTTSNPAVPGETILIYGTGLGLSVNNVTDLTGGQFVGPPTASQVPVTAQSGGTTINVISTGYKIGMVGINEIVLELPSTFTANALTRLSISQSSNTSNIVTIPVGSGGITHFLVTPQLGTIAAGTSMLLAITAQDAAGNTVVGYSGTVHLTSTDPNAVLPPDTALTNGTVTFSNLTFNTKGVQMVTATDTATGITGTSVGVNVN